MRFEGRMMWKLRQRSVAQSQKSIDPVHDKRRDRAWTFNLRHLSRKRSGWRGNGGQIGARALFDLVSKSRNSQSAWQARGLLNLGKQKQCAQTNGMLRVYCTGYAILNEHTANLCSARGAATSFERCVTPFPWPNRPWKTWQGGFARAAR